MGVTLMMFVCAGVCVVLLKYARRERKEWPMSIIVILAFLGLLAIGTGVLNLSR